MKFAEIARLWDLTDQSQLNTTVRPDEPLCTLAFDFVNLAHAFVVNVYNMLSATGLVNRFILANAGTRDGRVGRRRDGHDR